jgi:hypothetical protein
MIFLLVFSFPRTVAGPCSTFFLVHRDIAAAGVHFAGDPCFSDRMICAAISPM